MVTGPVISVAPADWAAELSTPPAPLSVLSSDPEPETPTKPDAPDTDAPPGKTQPAPNKPAPDPFHNPQEDPGGEPCPGPCTW